MGLFGNLRKNKWASAVIDGFAQGIPIDDRTLEMVILLLSCNPNTIELLGLNSEHIEEKLTYYKALAEGMSDDRNPDWEPLEEIFRRIVVNN